MAERKNNQLNIIKINMEDQFVEEIYRLTQYTLNCKIIFSKEEILDLVRIIRNVQVSDKPQEYLTRVKINFRNWLSDKFNKALFFHLLLNARTPNFKYIPTESINPLKESLSSKFPITGMSIKNLEGVVFKKLPPTIRYHTFGRINSFHDELSLHQKNIILLNPTNDRIKSITQYLMKEFSENHIPMINC